MKVSALWVTDGARTSWTNLKQAGRGAVCDVLWRVTYMESRRYSTLPSFPALTWIKSGKREEMKQILNTMSCLWS